MSPISGNYSSFDLLVCLYIITVKMISGEVMDALKNITVIEFSHMVMGPTAGMILADLGAEVIKIEPLGGDKTRKLKGSGAGYFAMFNRNKKSICVDLKSAEGQAVIRKLLVNADVMIENFRNGALDKIGLGRADIEKLNPKLIYQSSKGFLSGPYQDRTALDEVAQMMGGLAYMTGPTGRPLRAGASVIDISGAMFGVIGILAALFRRTETGSGAHVAASLYETTAFMVGQHIAQHAVTGTPAPPMPERVSAWAVYDVFDCADGQIFVGVVSDGQWETFCDTFGLSDWRDAEGYRTNSERVELRGDIIPRLQALFGGKPIAELEAKLETAGLPYAPIRKPQDLLSDPHLMAEGLETLTLPDTGEQVQLPRLPMALDGKRAALRRDLPAAGQDTAQVLEQLGFSIEEMAEMRESDVIG